MKKTRFAGLSQLNPNDPITVDGGAFVDADREAIDLFLEVGAVTHRHNARAPLPDPTASAVASAVASGGAIRADAVAYLGYSLEDGLGGETRMSPAVSVTLPPAFDSPQTALAGSADYTGGTLITDTYYYALTLVDAQGGETLAGPPKIIEREPGFATGRVRLGGLRADFGAGAVSWRLYRAIGGGSYALLATGTVDTYTDDGTVPADSTIIPPIQNLSNQDNSILLTVPSGGAMSSATGFNLWLSEDGTFQSPCFYDHYPTSSAAKAIKIPTLVVDDGAPPPVSRAVRGASKIDPDTELLDWPWKRAVSASAALGSGAAGDVRHDYGGGALYGAPAGGAANAQAWRALAGGVRRFKLGSGADPDFTLSSPVTIASTNTGPIRCTGRPMLVVATMVWFHSTNGAWAQLQAFMDGSAIAGIPTPLKHAQAASSRDQTVIFGIFTPSAGDHTFDLRAATSAATLSVVAAETGLVLVEL